MACLQSPGKRETLKNSVCIGFIMDMSNFCFKACLQLVKVSTVLLIFVGRGLFVKIQSLKETSTSLRSALMNILLICTIEIVFSVSQVLQATLQLACFRKSLFNLLYLLGKGLSVKNTESQDA